MLGANNDKSRADNTHAVVQLLQNQPSLEFAVLVGSRASNLAKIDSDWDIALQWHPQVDWFDLLGQTESLRHQLAKTLQTTPDQIDLIELRRANLAMRACVAEDGIPLVGQNTLAWTHFLNRTWRDLEDFYWSQHHAA